MLRNAFVYLDLYTICMGIALSVMD